MLESTLTKHDGRAVLFAVAELLVNCLNNETTYSYLTDHACCYHRLGTYVIIVTSLLTKSTSQRGNSDQKAAANAWPWSWNGVLILIVMFPAKVNHVPPMLLH